MELWQQVVLFLIQAVIIFLVIAGVIVLIAANANRGQSRKTLQVERWDQKSKELARWVRSPLMSAKDRKTEAKDEKKRAKEQDKTGENSACYVIDFKGDVKASAVDCLREEVTAVLGAAKPGEEVLVKVDSPGGMVHTYGLAASQLQRLRQGGLKLTVSVDKVAASGGYMMACTAERIIAAPFAIVGSIGVVAQVPNVHKLLKKHDVSYREYTAGEFKRTVSVFGEITEKGEQKFVEQLEETHLLFKDFVSKARPSLDVLRVATGEYWYGSRAMELGLVDAIQTSDDWLLERAKKGPVLCIKYQKKQAFNERLTGILGRAFGMGLSKTMEDLESRKFV